MANQNPENRVQENMIGVVGDGQLVRMMMPAIKRLGFEATVVGLVKNSPAEQMGAKQILASLTDEVATLQLAEVANYLTYEIEHINAVVLQKLAEEGKMVNPSPETLLMIKDKLKQKEFLRSVGIPVADFVGVRDKEDILEVAEMFGGKFLLKSRTGGYDGRGNAVIKSVEDIDAALTKFGDAPLYAERYVPFSDELAVMAARSMSGDIAMYPVVKTIHERNICETVIAQRKNTSEKYKRAEEMAYAVMQNLKGAGVFGIEMFATEDGKVLINEIAPRVHNSGHYTIEACETDQFEQHVRAITGLPLGNPEMKVGAAVMKNILGRRQGPAQLTGLAKALKIPNVHVHNYGKAETKVDRKMGHITVTGEYWDLVLANALRARELIEI